MGSRVSLSAFSRIMICKQKINNQSRKHILSQQGEGNFTSEVLIDEIFPVGAHESVAKHQVQTAEQEVIGVYQVISNHAEITWNKVQIMSLSTNHVYYSVQISQQESVGQICQICT